MSDVFISESTNLSILENLKCIVERHKILVEQYAGIGNLFSVVVIGQQNNGKSTLCNALCEDWSNKKFPVADRRLTETIQEEFGSNNDIIYVDTPGFSSINQNDDNTAQKQWHRANLLVFVHSVRTGELDKDEVETIKNLKDDIDELEKRLFIVCSKVSDEEHDRVDEVIQSVRRYLRTVLNLNVPVEAIDSKDYIAGKTVNDSDLIAESNMSKLLKWIDSNRNMTSTLSRAIQQIEEEARLEYNIAKISLKNNILHTKNKKIAYLNLLFQCWIDQIEKIMNCWIRCAKLISDKNDENYTLKKTFAEFYGRHSSIFKNMYNSESSYELSKILDTIKDIFKVYDSESTYELSKTLDTIKDKFNDSLNLKSNTLQDEEFERLLDKFNKKIDVLSNYEFDKLDKHLDKIIDELEELMHSILA